MSLKKQPAAEQSVAPKTKYAAPVGQAQPIVAPRQAVEQVASITSRSRFDVYVHGWRWAVEDLGDRLILAPITRRIPREPGVSGMGLADTPPGAPVQVDSSVCDTNHERRGWRKVYDGVLPSFPVICSDIYATADGGRAYLPRWERPQRGSSKIEVDGDIYAQFVAELVAAGLASAPLRADLEEQRGAALLAADAAEQSAEAKSSPMLRKQAARLREHAALLDAEIAKLGAQVEAAE